MDTEVMNPEQQIAAVRQTLERLEGTPSFRGKAELVADTRGYLARLLHLHSSGQLEPVLTSSAPLWPWVAVTLAILAAAGRLLLS